MEHIFVWRRAVFASLSLHILGAVILGLAGWHMSQSLQQETYEIDLSIGQEQVKQVSNTFAPPMSQAELSARVTAAAHEVSTVVDSQSGGGNGAPAGGTTTIHSTDTAPVAGVKPVTGSPSTAGQGTMAVPVGIGNGQGVGGDFDGSGTGTGGGTGLGEGTGSGTGEGDGSGIGEGTGEGSRGGSFDGNGFWNAVNSSKTYPAQAVKRGIEGHVTVRVELDGDGNLLSANVVSSSGSGILEQAALRAVERATPYQNASGRTQVIDVPLQFNLVD